MNETIKIINERVSLRKYSSKKLSRKHIDIILNSALRAPTAQNMMLYSIIEVNDQNTKDILGETCNHQWISKAPYVLLFLADMQKWYDYYQIKNIKEYCKKMGEKVATPSYSNLMMSCCDALIAAQNTVIAAESLNIGSCYIGDIMGKYEVHRELFNLSRWTFPITLVCYGYYPKNYEKNIKDRFEKKYICFKDKYNHLSEEDFINMLQDHAQKKRIINIAKKNNLTPAHQLYKDFSLGDAEVEEKRSVEKIIAQWMQKGNFK